MNLNRLAAFAFGGAMALMGAIAPTAKAELSYSIPAYCIYTEYGSTTPEAAMPCDLASDPGSYEISWEDGVYNHFVRQSDSDHQYTDILGGQVYQYFDTETGGNIFDMESGTLIVYTIEGCAH